MFVVKIVFDSLVYVGELLSRVENLLGGIVQRVEGMRSKRRRSRKVKKGDLFLPSLGRMQEEARIRLRDRVPIKT